MGAIDDTVELRLDPGSTKAWTDYGLAAPLDMTRHALELRLSQDWTSRSQVFLTVFDGDAGSAKINIGRLWPGIAHGDGWRVARLCAGRHHPEAKLGWRSSGLLSWRKIHRIRIAIGAGGADRGQSPCLRISGISHSARARTGRVVIRCDDGHASVWTHMKPEMDRFGFKGNLAVVTARIDAKRALGSYLDSRQLRLLQGEGWEICSHTHHHRNVLRDYRGRLEAYDDDLAMSVARLRDLGLTSASDWIAYPFGVVDQPGVNVVQRHFRYGMTTVALAQSAPFADTYRIGGVSVQNTTSTATITGLLQDAADYGHTVVLAYHRFVDGEATMTVERSVQDFRQDLIAIGESRLPVVMLTALQDDIP